MICEKCHADVGEAFITPGGAYWSCPNCGELGDAEVIEHKPTNGDRIRAMSDEELARKNIKFKCGIFIAMLPPLKNAFWTTIEEAEKANLNWLKQEAK